MKKKPLIILGLCFVIAIAVFAVWHSRQAGVPSQEEVIATLAEKGEEEAEKLLLGCSYEAVCAAWGSPEMTKFGVYGAVWETDNAISISISCDTDGKVTHVGFHAQVK